MTLRASRAACVASIVGVQVHEVPLDEDDLRAWLAGRALGLAPVRDPQTFSWAGPWIAVRGGEAVLMFGVPSGVVYDPAGIGENAPIERGWVVSPFDVALWNKADEGLEIGEGVVEELLVAAVAEAPVVALESVRVLPGLGLEGDRYAAPPGGTFGHKRVGGALTLMEREVLDELGLDAAAGRRNVVTRGIRLNALVGKRFMVGEVECLGQRLCEPCAHLDRLAGGGILKPLVHRGGLRADILGEGVLRVGDVVGLA